MPSNSDQVKNIAIFASGGGSNAEAIIQHFKTNPSINIVLIVSNKANAYVLERAKNNAIPTLLISNKELKEQTNLLLQNLEEKQIDLIVLAGFLRKIPEALINNYPNKIVNIHPSLLPKYGGKGMYGIKVHQAVFDNFELESGISIHYVNGVYDEGQIIFQAKVELEASDTPKRIAQKVLELEHKHYPEIIEKLLFNP